MKNFKQYIESKKADADKLDLKTAKVIAKEIIKKLNLKYIDTIKGNDFYKLNAGIPVGSIRREKALVGDIDILITKPISSAIIANIEGVTEIQSKGDKQIFFEYISDAGVVASLNLWILPKNQADSFGAMMLHTTGSHQYNILLRMIAKRAGEKLNQYGVFDSDNKQIAGMSEDEVYKALKTKKWPDGKEWKHPKDRK